MKVVFDIYNEVVVAYAALLGLEEEGIKKLKDFIESNDTVEADYLTAVDKFDEKAALELILVAMIMKNIK